MTTLAEVEAKESDATAAETKRAEFTGESTSADYIALNKTATDLRLAATELRAAYQVQLDRTQGGNNFDLDGSESFSIVTDFGSLRGTTGTDAPRPVNLNNIADPALADAFFLTHEGTRYIWTDGNTYTFGGSKDYGYGNAYEVGIAETDGLTYWDGSFPYDIIKPDNTDNGCSVDTANYKSDFSGMLDKYKPVVPIAGFFFRKPNFDPWNNAVSKNVGHGYDYQLGDTYGIQLSQNSHEISAIDLQHSFETVGISENHSHVGISMGFDAHGIDIALGIKAIDIGLDVTAAKFEVEYIGIGFSYSFKGIELSYENALKSYKLLDRPEFKISDENIQLLTSEKVETVAGAGIVLQVEGDALLMAQPSALLGGSESDGFDPKDLNFASRLYAAYLTQSTGVETSYNAVLADTNFNSDRVKTEVENRVASYSRVDLNLNSVGLASYSNSQAVLSELVLNSEKQLIELNIRNKTSELRQNVNNTTQMFDLTEGIYYVTHFENMATGYIGKMWIAKEATSGDDVGKGITKNSGGIYVQKADKNYASLDLDAELNLIDLANHKDDDNLVDLQADANTNKFTLDVKKASDVATLLMDATTGESKWHAKKGTKEFTIKHQNELTLSFKDSTESKLELKNNLATLSSEKIVLDAGSKVTAEAAVITLDSAEVKVGKMTVKDMEVTVPQATVTLGAGSKVAISAAGVDIKGPKLGITATAMLELKAAMIKLG